MPNPAMEGVGSWFERRARIAPERIALIAGDRSWTYAEVAARVRRLANGLRGIGVRRGNRVGWVGENHPAFLESLSAAALLGAAIAPVNHRLDDDGFAHVLAEAEPSVLVSDRAVEGALVPGSIRARVSVGATQRGAIDYEDVIAGASDDPIDEPIDANDLCVLPFTSGTTGRPKGVMLTHANVLWNAVNVESSIGVRGDDVALALAPFFRAGGFGINVLPLLFVGGTVVVPGPAAPDDILELIGRHRVTVGFGNPDLLQALRASSRWADADLSSLRIVVTGGAPVPLVLVHDYLDRGVSLVPGYGLSEAGPLALVLRPETVAAKPGAAGRPPAAVEVRIVDAGMGEVTPGQAGELLVRGPNVMAGYWRHPEATERVLVDGWLRTGDAARMDEDGDIWIVDRIEDAYESSEGRMFPADIERALLAHPAVADAGAVGVDGGDGPASGVAFVVLTR